MALVDAQVRLAIRSMLQSLLDNWDKQEIPFERAEEDAGFLYRTRGDVPGPPTYLAAAFFVTEDEEYAQAWYDQVGELT